MSSEDSDSSIDDGTTGDDSDKDKSGKPDGNPKPKVDKDKTSFDNIVSGLHKEIKTLQEKIARKENTADELNAKLSKMEVIVNKLAAIKEPPKIEKGESLLDAVCRTLGINDWF